MNIERLRLPAATSEKVEVDLVSYDSDPASLTWVGALDATKTTLESGAPATIATACTPINRGTTDAPDWKVQVPVTGASAGTYGIWLKVSNGVGNSPVRFCGQLILY